MKRSTKYAVWMLLSVLSLTAAGVAARYAATTERVALTDTRSGSPVTASDVDLQTPQQTAAMVEASKPEIRRQRWAGLVGDSQGAEPTYATSLDAATGNSDSSNTPVALASADSNTAKNDSQGSALASNANGTTGIAQAGVNGTNPGGSSGGANNSSSRGLGAGNSGAGSSGAGGSGGSGSAGSAAGQASATPASSTSTPGAADTNTAANGSSAGSDSSAAGSTSSSNSTANNTPAGSNNSTVSAGSTSNSGENNGSSNGNTASNGSGSDTHAGSNSSGSTVATATGSQPGQSMSSQGAPVAPATSVASPPLTNMIDSTLNGVTNPTTNDVLPNGELMGNNDVLPPASQGAAASQPVVVSAGGGHTPGGSVDHPLVPDANGIFHLTVTDPAQQYFFDPVAAIGYDYLVLSGPLVTSVTLPALGDNLYDIYGFTGNVPVLLEANWLAGVKYNFAGGGTDHFRIMEIDGLAEGQVFVAALTFASEGEVVLQQTAIFQNPEPSSFALAGMGLVGLGLCAWKRRRKARAA